MDIEHLEMFFFVVNNAPEDKKTASLLTLIYPSKPSKLWKLWVNV